MMKNPNHYGTVTKLSGNRRRPYIVKEGKTGNQRTIGYAATKEEALILLAKYNENPWNIDTQNITFIQLYELWWEKRAVKLSSANQQGLRAAHNYCTTLYDLAYCQIKAYQMQDCIDTCGKSYSMQQQIRNLFSHLDKFALEMDIVSKTYSSILTCQQTPPVKVRIPFTDNEVNTLWENESFPWVDSVLLLLYSGFRISEMLELEYQNVDLEAGIMQGGKKSAAGKNRIVPIHSKIDHIVRKRYEQSSGKYLFELDGGMVPIGQYRRFWSDIMEQFGMKHTPHECRHTFRSRMDSAGANKVCIDRIMGHASGGIGERVYTHKDIEELKLNIELITN